MLVGAVVVVVRLVVKEVRLAVGSVGEALLFVLLSVVAAVAVRCCPLLRLAAGEVPA